MLAFSYSGAYVGQSTLGIALLVLAQSDLLLHLVEVDVCNRILAVEDLGNLLQGRALGLDIEEVDEDELDEVPELRKRRELVKGPAQHGHDGIDLQCRTSTDSNELGDSPRPGGSFDYKGNQRRFFSVDR